VSDNTTLSLFLHTQISKNGAATQDLAREVDDLAGLSTPPQGLPSKAGMSAEELQLTLRIREVELRHKELEVEAMHIRVKALEIERGAALTSSPSPTHRPHTTPHDSFGVRGHIT